MYPLSTFSCRTGIRNKKANTITYLLLRNKNQGVGARGNRGWEEKKRQGKKERDIGILKGGLAGEMGGNKG